MKLLILIPLLLFLIFLSENKFEPLAVCGKFIEEDEEGEDFIASMQDVQVRGTARCVALTALCLFIRTPPRLKS